LKTYLLAIINSKLLSFIKTKASTTANKDDFTQLTLNDIRQLGIPSPSQSQKLVIDALVDKILVSKKSNPAADTSTLEMEIDKLVYEIYGLTEEEIKIVEAS
jgi:adenine-specific DNA-methyltransferase